MVRKSLNLEKTPWIGELLAKMTEIGRKAGKAGFSADFHHFRPMFGRHTGLLLPCFTTDHGCTGVHWLAILAAIRNVAWWATVGTAAAVQQRC